MLHRAEMICIFDKMGNKICYENSAVATKVHYQVVYHATDGSTEIVDDGEFREGSEHDTCLGKLDHLVKTTTRSKFKDQFAHWEAVSHLTHP